MAEKTEEYLESLYQEFQLSAEEKLTFLNIIVELRHLIHLMSGKVAIPVASDSEYAKNELQKLWDRVEKCPEKIQKAVRKYLDDLKMAFFV